MELREKIAGIAVELVIDLEHTELGCQMSDASTRRIGEQFRAAASLALEEARKIAQETVSAGVTRISKPAHEIDSEIAALAESLKG